MAEVYRHARDDRKVRFSKVGRIAMSGRYDGSYRYPDAVRSGDIDRIEHIPLRLALQLADVVQALDELDQEQYQYADIVKAYVARPNHCDSSSHTSERIDQVACDFPDDLFEQLDRYHEDH